MTTKAYWFIRTKTTYDPVVPIGSTIDAGFVRDVSNGFAALSGGYGNAGDLLYRANDRAVAGYILCDGSAVSRFSYKELFDVLGEAWGAGDGSTTFNIPDQTGLAGLVAAPPATPDQTVSGTSVASGTTVISPTQPGQAGGSTGGGVDSGGGFSWRERTAHL